MPRLAVYRAQRANSPGHLFGFYLGSAARIDGGLGQRQQEALRTGESSGFNLTLTDTGVREKPGKTLQSGGL